MTIYVCEYCGHRFYFTDEIETAYYNNELLMRCPMCGSINVKEENDDDTEKHKE